MHNKTFVGTVHKEIGKCNADELCKILEKVTPDVIFLEALDDTYSKYQQIIFSDFEVFHAKLEIRAFQKYSRVYKFKYVPVLGEELSYSFEEKFNLICQDIKFQKMLDNFESQTGMYGFDFLNSMEGMEFQKAMHDYGNSLISDIAIVQQFDNDIDEYENSMLRNIYKYFTNNKFKNAIFMCGNAHRQSIIKKLKEYKDKGIIDIKWNIYGS